MPGVPWRQKPLFKPAPDLPLEQLWAAAPQQTARMFKSAYYGLITRPEDMAYDRVCPYGFDDRMQAPAHVCPNSATSARSISGHVGDAGGPIAQA